MFSLVRTAEECEPPSASASKEHDARLWAGPPSVPAETADAACHSIISRRESRQAAVVVPRVLDMLNGEVGVQSLRWRPKRLPRHSSWPKETDH